MVSPKRQAKPPPPSPQKQQQQQQETSSSSPLDHALSLANLVASEPERFANGDASIAELSTLALKQLFDLSIRSESQAVPSIAAYINSVSPPDELEGRTSRSSSKRKRGEKAAPAHHQLFEPTPLDELIIDGMDSRQLWEQIDLKSSKVVALMDKLFVSEGMAQDDDEEDEDDEEAEEEDEESDDAEDDEEYEEEERVKLSELSDADLRALGIDPARRDELVDQDDESEAEPYAGASDISDGDPNEIYYEPLMTEAEQIRRKEQQESLMLPRLRSQVHPSDDDDDAEWEDDEDAEAEDEEEEEEEEEASSGKQQKSILDSLDERGANGAGPSGRGKRHPTLDDDFFSIDEFNRLSEAQDVQGEDDNDGEDLSNEVDLFKSYDDDQDMDEDDLDDVSMQPGMMDPSEIKFADFFLPPAKAQKFRKQADRKEKGKGKNKEAADLPEDDAESDAEPEEAEEPEEPERKRSIRFNDTVAIRCIKPRKKKELNMMAALGMTEEEEAARMADDFEEEEDEEMGSDMDEDEQEEEEEDEQEEDDDDDDEMLVDDDEEKAQKRVARRVAGDLFADSDDEEDDSVKVSTHERRLAALQEEISQLEQENVGKKDWTLMGEAGSKARPQDSLLEQDLEFERTAKVLPQVTQEHTETLEDLIKRRILDNHFDDVVRKREFEALPFLPSRLLELSDAKSSKSLAELYEDEYQAARGQADGDAPMVSESDAKLQKEHNEITQLYDDVFNKLDALSNAHFTPKVPKATIQTLSNTPAISVESALPSTSSSATMLAPEEVYDRHRHSSALEGDKSELTPEEKQRLHHNLRKEKRKRNDRIESTKKALELSGLVRSSKPRSKAEENKEKADALKKLVGNKGVSVIGKDGSQKKGKEAIGGKKSKTNGADTRVGAASGSKFKL